MALRFPRLIERRMILWPTRVGWLCLFAAFTLPALVWFFRGEEILSLTERKPGEILVVEGWIGLDGIIAASKEFQKGNYSYAIAAGSYSAPSWGNQRWNYADVAADTLIHNNIAKEKVGRAPARDAEAHRTYESALAVYAALKNITPKPRNVTIFTRGPHARRSRLVYAKVLGSDFNVGVVSWTPSGNELTRWWHSSLRAKEFIVETAAWAYELFLNSGRRSNHDEPPSGPPGAP